ncbi:hypothetical protein STVA_15910 [Allostella vacuolata]|nr:hypothetical protein STVA_15910 [Stella vacuolata]
MKPEDFAGQEPRFVLEEYFQGQTRAWGIFQDRFGTVRRQFAVDVDGVWDGSQLTLTEDFRYADGERERRVWRITRTGAHGYEGVADDVEGVAVGTAYGPALNWAYTLRLKVGEDRWRVRFDDWMFLQPDGKLINRATVSKFGITIGEVLIFFSKEPASRHRSETQSGRQPAPHPQRSAA